MTKTIIFFKGIYDTLDLFTDHLIEAFLSMGYGTFVYDARMQEQSKDELLELLAKSWRAKDIEEQVDPSGNTKKVCDLSENFAVVTFNNMGYNLDINPDNVQGIVESVKDIHIAPLSKENYVNLWNHYNIPYINILMDHPFHYERPLRNAPSTAIVLCTDVNHVKYIRRFFKNINKADFLPHAGVELHCKHKPLAERGIDVLYAGALPIYTVSKMIPDLTSIKELDAQKMAGEVLHELVSHPEKTTEQAIEEYVKAIGVSMSDTELQGLIVKMRFLDSYATSFFREQAVRILVESGIHVTAYGVGWNQCDWSDNPYLTYGGKVLAPEILPLMNNSKIVLNTMTWFKAGTHDRVFNGMLAGAAVVTDDSTYMKREFTDGKELVMFSLKELGTLPERVFDLFGHMDKMQELANRGYEAAQNGHTWKSRAEYIRECYL